MMGWLYGFKLYLHYISIYDSNNIVEDESTFPYKIMGWLGGGKDLLSEKCRVSLSNLSKSCV